MILAANIIKNHWHNDYGMTKTYHKTPKHENTKKPNKSGDKEEKATEEEYQAILAQKSKYREGTCYFCGKPGYNLPECPESESTPKDK